MNKFTNPSANISDNKLTSKAGYVFHFYDENWLLDKNTNLHIALIRGYLNSTDEENFLKVLAEYARKYSSHHVQNIFFRFLHYLRTTETTNIDSISLINYRSTLSNNIQWYLGTIRGFLKKWNSLGISGVSDEVIDLLDGWVLKGNIKGDVIKRLDPNKGPLSDIELLGFNEQSVQAYEKDNISLTELAIGLIVSNTGRRPIQISHLRLIDVLNGKNKRGDIVYLINVPRAKQRAIDFRTQFKQFAITEELWVILTAQAELVVRDVEDALGFEIQKNDRLELPLFPDMAALKDISSPRILRTSLKTDLLHIKSAHVTSVCKNIVKTTQMRSERTGEIINISSNRFRYTTGTRAAREGFGEMVIAELLDHSDNQNAGVYIKNIPEHVESLDKAVGQQMARYAQAFAGVLVDSEANAKRGEDINSRIKADGDNIGTCGSHGFCGANVPIPCYTCMHFQPWLDGPHEIVYQELLAERDRLMEVTGDIQIAAINDRSILAVEDVIVRCEERRKELSGG